MSPARRRNLQRLLKPRHVAVIGGREAEVVAGECARIGYRGPVWPVNPRRDSIGGHRCFGSVERLPHAPDAAFVAVPREAAIDTVARLAAMGAGGVVCHTAGFAEIGAQGARLEAALVEAAGDMALIGPNCYGFINYLDRAALWPFAHGGSCPGYGAAIVTQSGMLSSDLTMSRRSVPFALMASIGNQSVVTLADCVDVFSEFGGVRAIGLHVEEIPDVADFSAAVRKAARADIPVVALKTGVSEIGASLTAGHTGALSGGDDLYQALFDRLGVIRVATPAQLLETLKFLCVAGVPAGGRIAGLTCSGGAAAMLADYAQIAGLEFPPPTERTTEVLAGCLPHTATVSNPLDYTTPIWGQPERVRPVFDAVLRDPRDVAVIVQDYPLEGIDESKDSYLNDARSFIAATRAAGSSRGGVQHVAGEHRSGDPGDADRGGCGADAGDSRGHRRHRRCGVARAAPGTAAARCEKSRGRGGSWTRGWNRDRSRGRSWSQIRSSRPREDARRASGQDTPSRCRDARTGRARDQRAGRTGCRGEPRLSGRAEDGEPSTPAQDRGRRRRTGDCEPGGG